MAMKRTGWARDAGATWAVGLSLLCGCPRTPSPPGAATPPGAPRPRGPRAVTPHNELTAYGPYGTGNNACQVMLYAWDAAHPGCRYQLNHCTAAAGGDPPVCLSLADERAVACGAEGDACGVSVRCVCPEGAALVVHDPPDVVRIAPSADGARWTGPDGCTAHVARLAGRADAGDDPCEVSVHDCTGGDCHDRWVTVSCGGRSEVCGRPVRCDCGP